MAPSRDQEAELRLAIARDKLAAARALFAQQFYNDTLSKAYYAMFYASKCILWMLGEDPHRHKGVITFFGQKIVRVGLADARYGRLLADYERLREQADYKTAFRATKEQAANAIRDAEDFKRSARDVEENPSARKIKCPLIPKHSNCAKSAKTRGWAAGKNALTSSTPKAS